MAAVGLTEDVVNFLIHSGWRQFWLDGQLKLSPQSAQVLAEFLKISSQAVEDTSFLNILDPTESEKLCHQLAQSDSVILTTVLTLHVANKHPVPVEVMLSPSLKTDARSKYVGFIRPLPEHEIQKENARLLNRVEGLLEASRALNTLDLQDILNTIVQRISLLFKADHTVLYLADYESQKLSATAIHSSREMAHISTPSFNFGEGTVGWVLEHQKPIRINDTAQDERFIYISPESHLLTNLMSVPLTVKGEAIGVLEATHKSGGEDFTADDEALFSAFASQAAVAIHNARLFKETNQRLAEVSTLYTLANQLTQVLDVEHVIESSVTILKHALDCNSCCLLLKQNPADTSLTLKTCSGWPVLKENRTEIKLIADLTEKLFKKPSPIHIQDMREETDQAETELRSAMIMPLVVKEELLGAIVITDKQPYAFGQGEGWLLNIAAAQISTAIENSHLYENLDQRAIELEAALREVEQVNQLKSEFVENVAHELRTPLTFVKAYVALILEDELGEVPQTVKDKLEIISEKTGAIIRLVEDLVSLQKIEAGNLKLQSVPAQDLITEVAEWAIASAAEQNIEIVVDHGSDLPKVRVDIDRIGQVFDNLVGNALKFSPEGSRIHIGAEEEGGQVKFWVQDWGRGIPPDKLDKIFLRFYQISDIKETRYRGAGLGLTIVKQIIDAHNGQVTVDSVIDKGTTFSFWLPADNEPDGKSAD